MLNVSWSIFQILFPLASLRWNLRRGYLPLHLHRPSLSIMVVCCVARILDTDIGKPWWIWKCSSSWEHAQALGVIIGNNWDCSQFPRLCYNFSNKWTHYLLLSFSPVTKILPCVVFNKVIYTIHSNPGTPFYRTPPNDRSRIALGWYKEFQWSRYQK